MGMREMDETAKLSGWREVSICGVNKLLSPDDQLKFEAIKHGAAIAAAVVFTGGELSPEVKIRLDSLLGGEERKRERGPGLDL